MIVKYMKMRKICHFNGVGVISSANRLTLSKQTGRRMTIFYQNRACETHKKVIFQRFSPILFYFSDFIAKIVLSVGANIRAKLGQIRADYGAGEGQGQSPLYIYIYKRAYLPLFGDLPLHIPRRRQTETKKT